MGKQGSVVLGSIVGFTLMVFIGWVPFFGAFIAGLVAGMIAKGPGRGFLAGLGAATLGLLIITLAFAVAGTILAGVIGGVTFGLMGLGISVFLGILWLGGILIAALSGALGGLLSKPKRP